MADNASKIDAAAEKAFAEAAEKKTAEAVSAKLAVKPVEAAKPVPAAPAKPAVADKAPAKKAAVKKIAKPAAAKKAPAKAKRVTAKKPVTAKKIKKAASRKPAAKTTPISKLKDTIMATAKTAATTDFTKTVKEAAADVQTRAKAAYDKGTAMTADMTEFSKGNLEALVESGKILAAGVQDMGRTYVEEAKTAVETVQADVKKLAAVKSPTELFQLQGEIARRNFDAVIAAASKNSESFLKLANEAFAPVSGRMSLATEKFSKAA